MEFERDLIRERTAAGRAAARARGRKSAFTPMKIDVARWMFDEQDATVLRSPVSSESAERPSTVTSIPTGAGGRAECLIG